MDTWAEQTWNTLLGRNVGPCSVPTCDRDARFRGMCRAHYERVRTHGTPMADIPIQDPRWYQDIPPSPHPTPEQAAVIEREVLSAPPTFPDPVRITSFLTEEKTHERTERLLLRFVALDHDTEEYDALSANYSVSDVPDEAA